MRLFKQFAACSKCGVAYPLNERHECPKPDDELEIEQDEAKLVNVPFYTG